MNPIDFIRKLRKLFPPAQDSLTPDLLTLVALDQTLSTKYKLTILERAHIFNQAYKPDLFDLNRITRLGLKRCDLINDEQYKLIQTEISETL